MEGIKLRAMRDSLLERIHQLMKDDDKLYFVTADFGSPVLDRVRDNYPKRFINVGIAEQNLINISAGLALEGYKVFAYAIAPFITMRCFEQIRVNLALLSNARKMNVTLIGVGAGYSYVVSGPTHQCYEDISLMRSMPNVRVLSPSDQFVSESLVSECVATEGIKYLRLDAQVLPQIYEEGFSFPRNGFIEKEHGSDLCVISTGYMTHTAEALIVQLKGVGVSCGLVDLIDISHFSDKKMIETLENYKYVVSLEEGFSGRGGLDSRILNLINSYSLKCEYKNFGVEGGYQFEIGDRQSLHELVGIGMNVLFKKIKKWIE